MNNVEVTTIVMSFLFVVDVHYSHSHELVCGSYDFSRWFMSHKRLKSPLRFKATMVT
jgi:hypothetical protein